MKIPKPKRDEISKFISNVMKQPELTPDAITDKKNFIHSFIQTLKMNPHAAKLFLHKCEEYSIYKPSKKFSNLDYFETFIKPQHIETK